MFKCITNYIIVFAKKSASIHGQKESAWKASGIGALIPASTWIKHRFQSCGQIAHFKAFYFPD